VIGGALRDVFQGGAKQKAKDEWSKVDKELVDCLTRTVNPPPKKLAEQGVLPSDSRLRSYVDRCRRTIAEEQRKRELAEADRLKREEDTRRKEVARQEALKQKEEANRRLKEELSALRESESVKPLLEKDAHILLFSGKDTPNMKRGLDGQPRFERNPELCLVSNQQLAAGNEFSAFLRQQIERKLRQPFRETVCQPQKLTGRDMLLLPSAQIEKMPLEAQALLLREISGGGFQPILSVSSDDFERDKIRRKEESAALEARLGSGEAIYVLVHATSSVRSWCVLNSQGEDVLMDVFRDRRADWADVIPQASVPTRNVPDLDGGFVGIKRGNCGALLLSGSEAQQILAALRRDGVGAGLHPSFIASSELSAKRAEIGERRLAEEQRQIEARLEREERQKRQEEERRRIEAEKSRCKTKSVAGAYFVSACVAAGSEGRGNVDISSLRQKVEDDRAKLADCPADALDAVARAARQHAREAASKVSPLMAFQDALRVSCTKVSASILP
jgi:hypothetical protein